MQINYHGGDYLTLSDSYCSGMLLEQLVWSSGYVMLFQFKAARKHLKDSFLIWKSMVKVNQIEAMRRTSLIFFHWEHH
ncbi:unnamed protein product [Urochloa humidicola]